MGRRSRSSSLRSDVRAYAVASLIVATSALGSCLVEDDHCGENQVEVEGYVAACVCDDDSVPDPKGYGCMRCGRNEVVKDGKCECSEGFSRTGPTEPCEESEVGAECEPAAPECPESFSYCAPTSSDPSKGYCTVADCDAAEDCPTGWVCEMGVPRYCSRPPAGQSSPCASDDDCAGYEASYCALTSMACVVPGCATMEACHGDWVCCDLTAFGLTDICVPPARLTDGNCPGGAKPVKP